MKKIIKTIKLHQLEKVELDAKQMNALKGGAYCICVGCFCSGDISVMDGTDNGYSDCATNSNFN